MKDFLGNDIHEGDAVVIAIRAGRTASLSRGKVLKEEVRPQFAGGTPTNMVQIEWSSIHKYWVPARHVLGLAPYMIPEIRRRELNNVQEGIRVS